MLFRLNSTIIGLLVLSPTNSKLRKYRKKNDACGVINTSDSCSIFLTLKNQYLPDVYCHLVALRNWWVKSQKMVVKVVVHV